MSIVTLLFRTAFCMMFPAYVALAGTPEQFPNRPLTFIVPFEPGADTDASARILAKHAERFLGQPVIVKNRSGAAGILGFNEGASAPADGYTVTVATPSFVVTPHTAKGTRHFVKAYDAVYLPVGSPFILVVRGDAPWRTFREMLDHAKGNPDKVRLANAGNVGLAHIVGLGIEGAAGVRFNHIPYKGSGPGLIALLGGHVDGMLGAAGTVLEHVKSGKLKPFVVGSPERYTVFPDVPTLRELGFNQEASTWWGYVVPKGTPRQNIDFLAEAIRKTVETPEYREAVTRLLWVTYGLGPDAFGRFLEERDRQWSALIEKLVKEGAVDLK